MLFAQEALGIGSVIVTENHNILSVEFGYAGVVNAGGFIRNITRGEYRFLKLGYHGGGMPFG